MRGAIVSLSLFALATAASAAPLVTPGDVGERRWSLGAGLHFRGGSIAGFEGLELAVPGLSVERWFGRRFSLGLGLEARANLLITPGVAGWTAPFHGRAISLTGRVVLTETTAPVAVSVFATVTFSTASTRLRLVRDRFIEFTDAASLTGGLGFERWLHPRASVRLLVGVLRSDVTSNSFFFDGVVTEGVIPPSRGLSGRLDLLPSLELRWFF